MFRLKELQSQRFKPLTNFYRTYKSVTGVHGLKPLSKDIKEQDQDLVKVKDCLKHCQVQKIIQTYREEGFKYATKNPLGMLNRETKLLDLVSHELSDIAMNDVFDLQGMLQLGDAEKATFYDIQSHLEDTYCGNISFEVSHMTNKIERNWFYAVAEQKQKYILDNTSKRSIAEELLKAQVFENFLAKKFPTLKRYGGEGADSMLSFFKQLFSECAKGDVEDLLISIPHRGRLSLLTGMLNYHPSQLFRKIKGNPEFSTEYKFVGDVISHLTKSTDLYFDDKTLHVTMVPNPSHLEASHPVVSGKARSRQLSKSYGHYGEMNDVDKVVNIHVHGDAAVAGQGIVMETLAFSSLPHFDVGGTIHLIVNNQVGFTTPQERASTCDHCSDVGKIIGCPIIHVNGDYPEEVAMAATIALDYKKLYRKDIFINMHCFRRWGHNELDDPTFTNPSMYKIIDHKQSVIDSFKERLSQEGVLNLNESDNINSAYEMFLNEEINKSEDFQPAWTPFEGVWGNMKQANHESTTLWDTGCEIDLLKFVGAQSVDIAGKVCVHPHLEKTQCQSRMKKVESGLNIDWATAEALAIGTLLLEGNHVRICGQDVGRGTFSHRHAMFIDQETEEIFIPLNHMKDEQHLLEVVNSPLSEEAVLAYEYGMSIENPNHMVIWEAQFGDFFNGAQIIIDTFVCNGEAKWLLQSGLIMLLPHGMDGAGPDHSTCKIERFLQLSDSSETLIDGDDVSMQIVNPTTPAQYFHVLRRQQLRNFRKPLIVASPKLILRMSKATSSLSEMTNGTYFKPVIGAQVEGSKVEKVLFCSGKHYYELEKHREKIKRDDIAIIRLESLVPFPAEELKEELQKYQNAKDFIWCQEEQRNQGAWSFVNPRFKNLLNVNLTYSGREVLATSAIGVGKWHTMECEKLIKDIFS